MVANFTTAQIVGFPSQIVFTDTSTSPDGSVTDRRIYLAKYDGTFLVPVGNSGQFIDWPIASNPITVDCLDKDYALLMTAQWLYNDGSIQYSKIILAGFTLYNETFDYYLTQMMAANPLLINDNDFWNNKSTLRTDIDAGNQALSLASDQTNAQLCYDLATKL